MLLPRREPYSTTLPAFRKTIYVHSNDVTSDRRCQRSAGRDHLAANGRRRCFHPSLPGFGANSCAQPVDVTRNSSVEVTGYENIQLLAELRYVYTRRRPPLLAAAASAAVLLLLLRAMGADL